jgi:biopolymer transport protein ExbD
MTSMIDVVFLLLVFFVFSARFIVLEETLPSYLPKGRGDEPFPEQVMAEVVVGLGWKDEKASATAFTSGPYGGADRGLVAFGQHLDRRVGYVAPRFDEIERYLVDRVQQYGPKTPVTVHFENGVPWQVVVDVIDVCERVGLHDVAVGAEEIEP